MAIRGVTKCAVPECIEPVFGFCNLCELHIMPGAVVEVDGSTMIVTAWYAEHDDESGIILLNDWALGDYFSGEAGFRAKLLEQGFKNVRNLATPLELESTQKLPLGKKPGNWSGPWLPEYPWECTAHVRLQ